MSLCLCVCLCHWQREWIIFAVLSVGPVFLPLLTWFSTKNTRVSNTAEKKRQ